MILALDLGSTRFKAALYDEALREVATGSAPIPHTFGEAGLVEIAAADAVVACAAAVRECLAAGKTPAVRALAITSQAQTFTILDGAGTPQIPFVSWQDVRGGTAVAALAQTPGFAEFAEHSSFSEILGALQVAQLRRLGKEMLGCLASPQHVVHLPSYLVELLTGENVIDDNLAAMSGMYSLRLRAWWPAALAATGLAAEQLSRVVPAGSIAARTGAGAAACGLPPGVPVIFAGNDQTAGAYGAEVHRDDSLLVTLGTAHVAYRACAAEPRPAPGLVRGPYPGGRWYCLAVGSCGGNLVNWARTVLAGCGTDAEFLALAATAPAGCRGLVFEPDAPEGRGAWRNIGLHHGPAEFARAVLEALCRRMGELARRVSVGAGPARVQLAGGAAESALWREVLAQELGVAVERTTAGPLLGAARMAREAGH